MINLLLISGAFIFMEFIAWINHKYVMHGFLWKWHMDHHRKDHHNKLPENTEEKRFEKNDLFIAVFATPGILTMVFGLHYHFSPLVFISVGIIIYGLFYFLVHDVIIHKRFRIPLMNQMNNYYINGLIKAHTSHHFPKNKADFSNFGLFIFPFRYFKS